MDKHSNILVCVTKQKTCERLIRRASEMNSGNDGSFHVIHVAKNELKFLDNDKEGEALEYLFAISKSVGANLSVLKSDNLIKSISDFVNKNHIDCIVIGKSPEKKGRDNFNIQLQKELKGIEIITIP